MTDTSNIDRGKFEDNVEKLATGVYRFRDTDTGKLVYFAQAEGFVESIAVVDDE